MSSLARRDAPRGPDVGEILNQDRASAAQDLEAGSPEQNSAASRPRRKSERSNFGMKSASSPEDAKTAVGAMAATGGVPGEAHVDAETKSLQLLEQYLNNTKPPDAAFKGGKNRSNKQKDNHQDRTRTVLTRLGKELVFLECFTSLSGNTRLPSGRQAQIADKYSISVSVVKTIWAGRPGGTGGAAGSFDATKQLMDHFGHGGQGGAGALQEADDESAEESDEEVEEEEMMAQDEGVSDSDFGHWRVYHIVCVFQRECVCVCHVECACECRESERARDSKRASCSERDITL